MKNILKMAIIGTLAFCASCTDMFHSIQDYLDEGEGLYASKIDSLKAMPGNKRVLISGLLMYGYDTKQCVVTWQPGDGEAIIPIERTKPVEQFEYSVGGLTDAFYTFTIVTYDGEGVASLRQTLNARAYGDVYAGTLRARGVSGSEQDDEDVVVTFTGALQDSEKCVIVYTAKDGSTARQDIPVSAASITLSDWKSEGEYYMETYYLPSEDAVDSFVVRSETYTFPKYQAIGIVPKPGFSVVSLDDDLALNAWGSSMANLWDGIVNNDNFAHSWGGWSAGQPAWFTFDMGKQARLQAFRLNGIARSPDRLFNEGYMKTWEIWGRSDAPPQDGSWSGWTKLLDCESMKPSGKPTGEDTEEDIARGVAGETYLFPEDIQPVRYIRIKVNDLWNVTGNGPFLVLTELTLWEYLSQ